MTIKEYAKVFVGSPVPSVLIDLLMFEHVQGLEDNYSDGFSLITNSDFRWSVWSSAIGLSNDLIPFAQADSSGSIYALWCHGDCYDLNEAPIVVFGGEGHYHVVANNLLDFLLLLSFDVEPIVDDDGIYFYKDEENYEPSLHNRKYKKWLRKHFQLSPISSNFAAEALTERAQRRHQSTFLIWLKLFAQQKFSFN
ncbi:MAG: hypothetical protein ACRBFS_04070 [Aureispira sp.]